MLTPTLRRAYDKGKISLLPLDGEREDAGGEGEERWLVLYFCPPIERVPHSSPLARAFRELHGAIVSVSGPPVTRPERGLARWHCEQAIRERLGWH